jgi:cob(I)alamin adenosyltransferase
MTNESDEGQRPTARFGANKKGLVIVNTGDGKGKTTAALGMVLRAWGRGMRVGVLQFLKNEHANYGEVRAGKKLEIMFLPMGDGWTWTSKDMDQTVAQALYGWEQAKTSIVEGQYDVLVLDEFTYLLYFGWLDVNEVVAWLRENKPPMLHLVITGRYAPPELIAYSDLVTEMREVKHPFKDQGIRAQRGVEF